MDDHLRLESLSAAALRTLLAQERARRQELEQEVARLRAALARQNEAIIALERQNTELRREQQELRTLVAGLTEQNALWRRQAALLHQENARLRGIPLALLPTPPRRSKRPHPSGRVGNGRSEHRSTMAADIGWSAPIAGWIMPPSSVRIVGSS